MSTHSAKAAARKKRRETRRSHHDPLLRLMQEEPRRKVRAVAELPEPLTDAQRLYDAAITANPVTFGVGPAGTGKTWWAAMRAGIMLREEKIRQIIITRPAVEAGESLGFLPGELDEKFDPYFRPVREALEEALGSGPLDYMIRTGRIEARPLGLLRGASIRDSWLIADEMQNATVTQMKLLLTRIGKNARFIINGDPTQCDLPDPSRSGLEDAMYRLAHVRGIGIVRFGETDIVRSGICQEIVMAYSTLSRERYTHDENLDGVRRLLRV